MWFLEFINVAESRSFFTVALLLKLLDIGSECCQVLLWIQIKLKCFLGTMQKQQSLDVVFVFVLFF